VSAGHTLAGCGYVAGLWALSAFGAANAADEPCQFSLTRQSPVGGCDIPSSAPAAMVLPVRPRANPAGVPVNLRIAVLTKSGESAMLPPVSLFPADQEGRFLLRLPMRASRLIFTLIDGPGQLAVDVGPVSWLLVLP
jgi:hypothetical protein